MSSFNQVSRRAKKLEANGQTGEAIKLYELFLQDFPKNTRAQAMLEKLRSSVSADADEVQDDYTTARKLIERGELANGIALAQQIVEKLPDNAPVWNLLGTACFQDNQPVEAERYLRKAIEIDKNFGVAWVNLATLFYAQNRLELALKAFQNASYLDPENGGLLNSIAGILISLRRLDEAEPFCVRAIQKQPDLSGAYNNLAIIFYRRRKHAAAKQAFEKAVQLKPDDMSALGEYLYVRAQICDWSPLPPELRITKPLGRPGNSISPFSMLHFEDDPLAQRKRSEIRSLDYVVKNQPPTFQRPASRPKKLKIGYFSADFHNHATLSLMMGLLALHDKDRFEIHAYSYGNITEGWRRSKLQKMVDKNWDVQSASDDEIVRHARAQGIDIAIDLKGYTQFARPRLFAHRMAPLQVNYVGYPGTLGTNCIDYLVADHTVIPDAQRDAYAEKIIYMPHCYQPNDGGRVYPENTQTRTELGLPEDGFVFCSFNACYKISPREFDIWMRLLDKVEGSVLWLFQGNDDAVINLREETKARGIDPNRLVFAGHLPEAEHLARHKHADLFLDTFNVNAHTTASDALWAGLPLVTLPGEQFAARVAASILTAANLPELIAKDEAEYEAIALDLALHPEKTIALKQKLQEQIKTCPLFDSEGYTRDLEAGFEAAYDRFLQGLPPDDIEV
ncbi:tetratricopeptide repeat protein [Thalassospira sp. HF15]|uniref:O-linked N-acetylglucosamine transferase, SPINDLY family protein n=1 Tax=Thalassospira sp. HF15 TaxID=2722755 RepID=UPI00142F855D|nr:tetratricopeptide repeat protein [Thalassospira sp. HF15]